MIPESVLAIARDIRARGGRALLVGGYVRDQLLGGDNKDLDFEIYGVTVDELERILARHGEVITIGRSFGVLQVKGLGVDFALPRLDFKTGTGHKGFEVSVDPLLDYANASRRRDLTINSMALDPLTGELLDPHGGRKDLEAKVLRATDPRYFGDDPLRGLRVAQFAARFEMRPDPELKALCAALDLSELSAERIFGELEKLLLKSNKPSIGLELLRETRLLRYFPELECLVGLRQDPVWHPEGDVWTHTLMVVDRAAKLEDGGPDDLTLMLAALCHDLGKATTTSIDADHIRSLNHEPEGARLTQAFLERLKASNELTAAAAVLVEHHLAPTMLIDQNASDKAFRRLARKLEAAGATMLLLERVARADHLGRTTPEAVAGLYPEGDAFLERARALDVSHVAPVDVVLGRHVLARGIAPGPAVGDILRRCREVQDETGWDDADRILDAVLH